MKIYYAYNILCQISNPLLKVYSLYYINSLVNIILILNAIFSP